VQPVAAYSNPRANLGRVLRKLKLRSPREFRSVANPRTQSEHCKLQYSPELRIGCKCGGLLSDTGGLGVGDNTQRVQSYSGTQ